MDKLVVFAVESLTCTLYHIIMQRYLSRPRKQSIGRRLNVVIGLPQSSNYRLTFESHRRQL